MLIRIERKYIHFLFRKGCKLSDKEFEPDYETEKSFVLISSHGKKTYIPKKVCFIQYGYENEKPNKKSIFSDDMDKILEI